MASLAFSLRHADEMAVLGELGQDRPAATSQEDWDAFWSVVDRTTDQVEATLTAVCSEFEQSLHRNGLRFERVTRANTAREKWESWGRVFQTGSRTPLGSLGGAIGVDASRPTLLSIWWGYAKARGIRGPHLAEKLRVRGEGKVRLGQVRNGWLAGTVLLAEMDLGIPQPVAACVKVARLATDILKRHREVFTQI